MSRTKSPHQLLIELLHIAKKNDGKTVDKFHYYRLCVNTGINIKADRRKNKKQKKITNYTLPNCICGHYIPTEPVETLPTIFEEFEPLHTAQN